jgi:hypothetical protein
LDIFLQPFAAVFVSVQLWSSRHPALPLSPAVSRECCLYKPVNLPVRERIWQGGQRNNQDHHVALAGR